MKQFIVIMWLVLGRTSQWAQTCLIPDIAFSHDNEHFFRREERRKGMWDLSANNYELDASLLGYFHHNTISCNSQQPPELGIDPI